MQKPGEYPFANGMTAATAVAVAGGFTQKAVDSVVYVRHPGDNAEQRLVAHRCDGDPSGRYGPRIDSTTFWDVMDVLAPIVGVSALRFAFQ